MSQIIGIPIFLCSSIFIWFFSCGSWQINQHPALICASRTCQRIRLLSSLYCSLLLHAIRIRNSEWELLVVLEYKDGRAWDPGFFLALVSWLISRSRWLVVGARINHTIPLRSGHSQINAHPTRLVKASAEQCSKSKKEPEVLVATMQPNTKGTEPTFSNPSFFFLKKRNTV